MKLVVRGRLVSVTPARLHRIERGEPRPTQKRWFIASTRSRLNLHSNSNSSTLPPRTGNSRAEYGDVGVTVTCRSVDA